ncbi:MAG: DNA methyltransferase, partial [bacterium]
NDLNGSRWLQFQKSWFICENDRLHIDEFIAFFTKKKYPDGHQGTICLASQDLFESLPNSVKSSREFILKEALSTDTELDYAIIDARHLSSSQANGNDWQNAITGIHHIADRLRTNTYLTIIAQNSRSQSETHPFAWELAKSVKAFLTQKDEKIGCFRDTFSHTQGANAWVPDDRIIYFLNFRKENGVIENLSLDNLTFNNKITPQSENTSLQTNGFTESWFIHKPPPRSKNVLLHPAKFPENLIQKYIENFTQKDEWVFDPMAGTGSAILAALESNRWACGIELNPDFAEIAKTRFRQTDKAVLVTGDAADEQSYAGLPEQIDYCITSPPYWDMLRMKGAETQARRKKEGLQRWYSEDGRDVGNIADYVVFLDALEAIYKQVAIRLRPGRYMTIIVKNVKKKGTIYPLAWDIVGRLSKYLVFSGEQFWCQDDQRLSPFGYRYVWVSNTFHHYCLTFRKE